MVVIKPVAILLILAVSGTTYAETHICRSEVGFQLDVVNGKEFNSTVTDSSWDFVQTEKNGKWIRWISVISVAEGSQIVMVSMGLCTKI